MVTAPISAPHKGAAHISYTEYDCGIVYNILLYSLYYTLLDTSYYLPFIIFVTSRWFASFNWL